MLSGFRRLKSGFDLKILSHKHRFVLHSYDVKGKSIYLMLCDGLISHPA